MLLFISDWHYMYFNIPDLYRLFLSVESLLDNACDDIRNHVSLSLTCSF